VGNPGFLSTGGWKDFCKYPVTAKGGPLKTVDKYVEDVDTRE
jgi:hypothetical protein